MRLSGVYNVVLRGLAVVLRRLRRRPDRWLFGGCGGSRFADNSAWLFLWVIQQCPEVRAAWSTKNFGLWRRMHAVGLPAVLEWSPRGLWLAARAGNVVISHGPADVAFPVAAGPGSFIANLWHGLPFKAILLDHPPDRARMEAAAGLPRWRAGGLTGDPDVLAAMTPSGARRMAQASGLPPARVAAIGSPRLQALTASAPRWPFRDDETAVDRAWAQARPRVLFLPTWGMSAAAREGLLGPQVLEWIRRTGGRIILKPHPNDPAATMPRQWADAVQLASASLDATLLLAQADILVTDVSSVLVDMLACGRPAVVVRPTWGQEERTLYQDPAEFVVTPAVKGDAALHRALVAAWDMRQSGRSNAVAAARPWLPTEIAECCPRVWQALAAIRPKPA